MEYYYKGLVYSFSDKESRSRPLHASHGVVSSSSRCLRPVYLFGLPDDLSLFVRTIYCTGTPSRGGLVGVYRATSTTQMVAEHLGIHFSTSPIMYRKMSITLYVTRCRCRCTCITCIIIIIIIKCYILLL